MDYQIEVYSAGLDHPECVAIAPDGRVWAGGEAGQVYVIDPESRQPAEICRLPADGGRSDFRTGRGTATCAARTTRWVRVSPSGDWEVFCSSVDGRPLRAPNYPAFGPDRSLYVSGSGDYPGPTGEIYRIDPDGSAEVFHSGPFHYANGLAIDRAAEYLYIAQTATDDVVRVPLSGPEEPPEQVCPPGALLPMPDGLAFDSGQNLYVTSFGASALERIRPERPDRVDCPGRAGSYDQPGHELRLRRTRPGPPLPGQPGRLAHLRANPRPSRPNTLFA